VFHAQEVITNYCRACNVVLCPTCVCDHNVSHDNCGTHAQYQNISDTLANVKDRLLRNIKEFSEERIMLDRLSKSTDMIPSKIRQKIEEAKRTTWEKVSESFDRLEGQILEYTLSADLRRCTVLIDRIDELVHGLYESIEVLKTEDFGETLIQFMAEDHHKFDTEKIEIEKYIDSIKLKSLPDIEISSEAISEVATLVSKMLVVRYYKSKKDVSERPTLEYHSNSILQNPVKANRMARSNVVPSSYMEKGLPKFTQDHHTEKLGRSSYDPAPERSLRNDQPPSGRYDREMDYQTILERIKHLERGSETAER
jgi:hypothetical protein